MRRDGGLHMYFISDILIELDKKLVTLYMCRHNQNESDPAFSEADEGTGYFKTTILQKTEQQGAAHGGHLMVTLTGLPVDEGFRYFCAVEDATGLGRSLASQLLRYAFDAIYRDDPQSMTAIRQTGKKSKPEPYRPLFDFWGVPAQNLEAELQAGVGNDLRLVRLEPLKAVGQAATALKVEEFVVVLATRDKPLPKTIPEIKKLIMSIPGKVSKATYAFRRNGAQQRISFRVVGDDVFLDEKFIQKEIIGPNSRKDGRCERRWENYR